VHFSTTVQYYELQINQSISQSINQSISQSISQSMCLFQEWTHITKTEKQKR